MIKPKEFNMNVFRQEYDKLDRYIKNCKKTKGVKQCNECDKFCRCIPIELMEGIEYAISKAMNYGSEYNE